MSIKQKNPMHPGAFVKNVYLVPNNVGPNEFSLQLKVSEALVSRILDGKSGVSAEIALIFSVVLGRSPESWLQMQKNYDLWQARKEVDLGEYHNLIPLNM